MKVIVLIVAGFLMISFLSCNQSPKLEIPTTTDLALKVRSDEKNTVIDSFEVHLIKRISQREYLLTYKIVGSIQSRALAYKVLDKVLVEQSHIKSVVGEDYIVNIIPIYRNVGKAPNAVSGYNFSFSNEFLFENSSNVKEVQFICGDKSQTINIPKN